jgi:hypothetical protein
MKLNPFRAAACFSLLAGLSGRAVPVAQPDEFDALEDVPLVVPAPGIFGNDTADFADTTLAAIITQQPANGTLTLNADGSMVYTPSPGFSGTDTFRYQAVGVRNFVIDRARSVLNVRLSANVSGLGTASDNKNGRVVGTVKCLLNPAVAPLQGIHVQDIEAELDERISLRLSWLFGLATITGEIDPTRATDPDYLNITMDRPGPPVVVAAGGLFTQPGNLFSAVGRARTTATGAAAAVELPPTLDINTTGIPYDIAVVPNEPTLSAPKVAVVGTNLELTIPLKVEQTLVDPAYTGTIVAKGNVVAVAPVNPAPVSSPVTVTVRVAPTDDPPSAVADQYVTRQNLALSVPATAAVTTEVLIPAGSVWKWRTGSDLGTAWRQWSYDSAAWASGAGPLGYGDGDEATLVEDNPEPGYSNVPVPQDRYPTAYFLREFTLRNALEARLVEFELMRDDAAVVYVNGVEVYRDSAPFTAGGPAPLPAAPAAITYGTLAAASIPNEQENAYRAAVAVPRHLFFEGRNVIAVEVHQAGSGGIVNSSDMSFDLRLRCERGVAGVLANDVDPEGDPFTAQLLSAPSRGTVVLNTDGSFVYRPTPGLSGTDTFRYRLNQLGQPVVTSQLILPTSADVLPGQEPVWKYLDTGVDPGTQWRLASFNDTAWKEGRAELGYGDGDEETVVEDNPEPGYSNVPNPGNRFITTWFRKKVTITDRSQLSALRWRAKRDDGIAVYLNGTRIFTDNMPASFTATTPALGAVANENDYIEFRQTNLASVVDGENIISAEIHQSDASSSDMSFDLGLTAEYIVGATVTIEVAPDDTDNDGISDTWEREYGFSTSEVTGSGDADGDGQNDRAEFLAGTQPRDPASSLRPLGMERVPGGGLRMEFATVPGLRYQLERSAPGGWINEGIPVTAAGSTTVWNLAVPAAASTFWRLRCLATWP